MGKRVRRARKARAEEDTDDDDTQLTGLAAKIVRQQKFLWEKMGGAEEEMYDEQEDENGCAVWSRSKRLYYGADEASSSDEELLAEEEAEVIRVQREKAKSLSIEDFGLEEDIIKGNIDREPTLGDIAGQRQGKIDSAIGVNIEGKGAQIWNSILSSTPAKREKNKNKRRLEPVNGMLYDFDDATGMKQQWRNGNASLSKSSQLSSLKDNHEEIAGKIQGKLDSVIPKGEKNKKKGHLKPVKGMLETWEGFDDDATGTKQLRNENASSSKPSKLSNRMNKYKAQSMEMLKMRAALEEKFRHCKFIPSAPPSKREKNEKKLKPINGMLETLDDFDDDVAGTDVTGHGLRKGSASLSKSINSSLLAVHNKPKSISGDYDLRKRDDIGERRKKHELRVLSRVGIEPEEEAGNLDRSGSKKSESEESENEFYEQVKRQRAAKLAAKADKYSRTSRTQALPEIVDGRRPISYQMEKNRGLTRYRKKSTKNPRQKYKTKHQTALVRRKGQVREVRRPWGSYGGEPSGINAEISRSIRFKN